MKSVVMINAMKNIVMINIRKNVVMINAIKSVVMINVSKVDKRIYLQMHLFGVMSHGGPVRLSEEWGCPPMVEVIFVGVDFVSLFEVFAKYPCQDLIRAFFFWLYRADPVVNYTGV